MVHDMSVFPEYIRDDPSNWWACEHPERPWDQFALFDDENCRGCRLALRAVAANGLGHIVLIQSKTMLKTTVTQWVESLA